MNLEFIGIHWNSLVFASSETQRQLLVGGGKKSKRARKKFRRRKVKIAFLTFLRLNFFLPRLDFFPTPPPP